MSKSLNKATIIEKIAENTKVPKTDVIKVVDNFFDTVKTTLKQNQNVKLVGFGTFKVNNRKARTGHNPHTGEKIDIPASLSPKFTPGKQFKDYLN